MPILGPFDFRGGYSIGSDFTSVPYGKNYATTMQNCRFKDGVVVPRWSFRSLVTNALLSQILGLTVWTDTVNSKLSLVGTSSGASGKLVQADITSFDPTQTVVTAFTDYTGALAASSVNWYTTFDSLNNILVGSANSASSGVVFKVTAYNANGAALGGSPPSADIVKQCNNFMFLSRNLSSTTTQSKVYWSNVNDPETWTAANVLDFNKNDGEPVMALGSIGTDLYIFKKTSIGRLSTVTVTTSGAVTLGPLVTVIRGVGCCGPRAIDNLPNGNIVFLGTNGHFYEFDGSTLLDHSRQKYDAPNVYDQSRHIISGGSVNNSVTYDIGLSNIAADHTVTVKTVRGVNEVYITSPTTNGGVSIGPYTFIWDFEQQIWQGTGFNSDGSGSLQGGFASATATPAPAGLAFPFESSDALIFADDTFRARVCGDAKHPYPGNSTSSLTPAMEIATTIRLLNQDGEPFIPRSICFETNNTQTASGNQASIGSFIVYANFDTYPATTAIYTATAGTILPTRIIVSLSFVQSPVGTNIFPMYLTVRFVMRGQGANANATNNTDIFRLGKFWLSDEIVR